ncbi:MAG: ABC transporter ATP-binding protein [Alphaproteobacteria bacterium]
MTEPALRTDDLCKSFGALAVTDHVSLSVAPGEMHALIGPNGAGKTTLIAQLSGELPSDSGRIYFEGQDITSLPVYRRSAIGIARTFQITSIFRSFSAQANAALSAQAHDGHSFRFWRPAERFEKLQDIGARMLDRVGLSSRARVRAADLSHGEHRMLELAMALSTAPRLFLLDEPMAGLGPSESAAMMEMLRTLKGTHTVVLVEHDMDAVFSLADRISVLAQGRVIATGTPDEIRRNREVRLAYLGDESEGPAHHA